jgi:hypothetical protein
LRYRYDEILSSSRDAIHANQSNYPSGYNAAPIDRLDRAMLDFRDAWTFSSEHISVHGLQP